MKTGIYFGLFNMLVGLLIGYSFFNESANDTGRIFMILFPILMLISGIHYWKKIITQSHNNLNGVPLIAGVFSSFVALYSAFLLLLSIKIGVSWFTPKLSLNLGTFLSNFKLILYFGLFAVPGSVLVGYLLNFLFLRKRSL